MPRSRLDTSSGSVLVPSRGDQHSRRAPNTAPSMPFRYLPAPIKIELLRKKVKYVFVLFQENRPSTIISAPIRAPTACSTPGRLITQAKDSRATRSTIATPTAARTDHAVPDPADGEARRQRQGYRAALPGRHRSRSITRHPAWSTALHVEASDRQSRTERPLRAQRGRPDAPTRPATIVTQHRPRRPPSDAGAEAEGRADAEPYRLRHHPVPVALRRPLHAVRQFPPDHPSARRRRTRSR